MEGIVMSIVRVMKRGGDDLHEYKKALKMAKKAIETLCELSDEMEDRYGYDEEDEEEREDTREYRSRRRL